jgi:hypothetical protein
MRSKKTVAAGAAFVRRKLARRMVRVRFMAGGDGFYGFIGFSPERQARKAAMPFSCAKFKKRHPVSRVPL